MDKDEGPWNRAFIKCEPTEYELVDSKESNDDPQKDEENISELPTIYFQKLHSCGQCQQEFQTAQSLRNHIYTHSLAEGINSQSKKKYVCKICNKAYPSPSKLETHVNSHLNIKPFECDICKKRFRHRHNMRKHVLIHMESGTHRCPICEKGFVSSNSLKIHMGLHSGIKDKECIVCKKRFTITSNLTRHMYNHGERSFQCDICLKRFKRPDALKNHKRTHLDENERKLLYKCEICEKGFIKKYKLNRHMDSHSRENPVECEICNKKFRYRSCFTRHKLLHNEQNEDKHSEKVSIFEFDCRNHKIGSENSIIFSVKKEEPCDSLYACSEIDFEDVKLEDVNQI